MFPFCLSSRCIVAGLCAIGVGGLAFALLMQYGFDFRPCILCLYQRVPYGVMAVLCGAAVLMPLSEGALRTVIGCCVLLLLISGGIGGYQIGVEQHWWQGTDACSGGSILSLQAENLPDLFSEAPPARCDEVVWSLFGLSMASWNLLFSFAVAGILVVILRHRA